MTEVVATVRTDSGFSARANEVSMFSVAATVMRRRRLILLFGFIGGVAGAMTGLLQTRRYTTSATFLAQASEQANIGGLAAAASQLGIRVPATGGGWSPELYAKLARSRSVLDPIAADTITVPEVSSSPTRIVDLLKVKGASPEARLAGASQRLSRMIEAGEQKQLGTVVLTVSTPWPTFSLALAHRVLAQINRFNLDTRRSQATAEREFVEEQSKSAEHTLREAENRLQAFLQGNRDIRAPQLSFEHERLQREVTLAQSVFTTLLQSREEARIREVRDTPVITVLEQPRIPLKADGRGTLLKAIGGGLLGAVLAILIVFAREAFETMRRTQSDEVREFVAAAEQALPSVFRRAGV